MKSKRYKLLKELPYCEVGDVLNLLSADDIYWADGIRCASDLKEVILRILRSKEPGWLEEVNDEPDKIDPKSGVGIFAKVQALINNQNKIIDKLDE